MKFKFIPGVILLQVVALLVSPTYAAMCIECCEHWISTALDLLATGGFDDYVRDVLYPHIRANCS